MICCWCFAVVAHSPRSGKMSNRITEQRQHSGGIAATPQHSNLNRWVGGKNAAFQQEHQAFSQSGATTSALQRATVAASACVCLPYAATCPPCPAVSGSQDPLMLQHTRPFMLRPASLLLLVLQLLLLLSPCQLLVLPPGPCQPAGPPAQHTPTGPAQPSTAAHEPVVKRRDRY